MRKSASDDGFTLVELMVVVLIIGILVAVAIPVYGAVSARARRGACQANLRTLDGATGQWLATEQGRDRTIIDGTSDTAVVRNALSPYVRDWFESTRCTTDEAPYLWEDGFASCVNSTTLDHVYP